MLKSKLVERRLSMRKQEKSKRHVTMGLSAELKRVLCRPSEVRLESYWL